MTNCFETPELGALVFDFNWRKRLGALGFLEFRKIKKIASSALRASVAQGSTLFYSNEN